MKLSQNNPEALRRPLTSFVVFVGDFTRKQIKPLRIALRGSGEVLRRWLLWALPVGEDPVAVSQRVLA